MENFSAVYEQHGDWWIGCVEEHPGANTQDRTLDEARENLKEAVLLVIEANRKLVRLGYAGPLLSSIGVHPCPSVGGPLTRFGGSLALPPSNASRGTGRGSRMTIR